MKRANADNSAETELVRRAKAGDRSAFAELVAKYQDRVYNTCYRMCHNHADALDLTQTAFMKAYEALPRFEVQARFYTWLYRIAVNLALSQRRSARRRGGYSLSGTTAPHDPPAQVTDTDPHRRVEKWELHQRVQGALDRLDDEFRAPVVLRDIEGLDYAEIAEVLELPLGTVKSRIFRGRALLRQMLQDPEESERDAG